MEVLVVGNTAYVDDDFCAKAFPGDHVQVVAAQDAYRDESSPHSSWKELLQHLDQAYSHLLSHTVSSAVPSADWVLTVVFGMGTGVSPNRIGTRNLSA